MKKRALISVWDKNGIVEFSKSLIEREFEILSTGGTKALLEKNGVPVISVSDLTEFNPSGYFLSTSAPVHSSPPADGVTGTLYQLMTGNSPVDFLTTSDANLIFYSASR